MSQYFARKRVEELSSTEPLAADIAFAPPPVDGIGFTWITVTAVATGFGPGGIPGVLYIEYSHDKTTWYSQGYSVGLLRRTSFSRQILARHVRIRFVNWKIPQASLFLDSVLHNEAPPVPAQGQDDPLLGPAIVASTSITGLGMISAGIESEVWPGVANADFTAPAAVVSIVSDSDEDKPLGTGAGAIAVDGNADDPDGYLVRTVLELNGSLPVLTTVPVTPPLIGISVFQPGTAGTAQEQLARQWSTQIPVGTITATIGGVFAGSIPVGTGNTMLSTSRLAISIPGLAQSAVTTTLTRLVASAVPVSNGTGEADLLVYTRTASSGVWKLVTPPLKFSTTALATGSRDISLAIAGGTAIIIRCRSTRDITITAGLDGYSNGPPPTVCTDGSCPGQTP